MVKSRVLNQDRGIKIEMHTRTLIESKLSTEAILTPILQPNKKDYQKDV